MSYDNQKYSLMDKLFVNLNAFYTSLLYGSFNFRRT